MLIAAGAVAAERFWMDSRPIGVFDSGLGGLTTVKKLAEFMPNEEIIYLGDTGRVPYGSRSEKTIIKYAGQDAAFLAGFDIKAMVIACNTVCSTAYNILENAYNIPVYEVVRTPSKAAALLTKNGKIGVIGTTATIRSGAYEKALREVSPESIVTSVPCPLFVPLVENGRINDDDPAVMAIAGDYLGPILESGSDTLVMGCTHYPLLRSAISKILGPGIALIDSGEETAKHVAEDLAARDMLSEKDTQGTIRYYVTDSAEGFSQLASRYLEADVRGKVEQVELE